MARSGAARGPGPHAGAALRRRSRARASCCGGRCTAVAAGASLRREPGAGARLFFALWPDPGWCEQLLEAAQPLIAGGAGRSVAKSDLHVTLCFLGAVAEDVATRLPERAARIESAAFELLFDAFQDWPRSRILAASCSIVPVAASELARKLRALALE